MKESVENAHIVSGAVHDLAVRASRWNRKPVASPKTPKAKASPVLEMIEPVELASYSGGARTPVSWTTLNVAEYVPSTAKHAYVYFEGCDEGDQVHTCSIEVRGESGGSEYVAGSGSITGFSDADTNFSNTMFVPLSASGTFDYQVAGGFRDGWKIVLYGYW